ncbi:hypothetical protein [Fervidicoccus fontis]|uniref:Uncharacterized protein n=1 Tax=Fervidicoccus fontis TaxID=683846 RepID=A0A2J6N3Z6_9CREN|nr:hypothetical protein [Fervidicoccus fontis]PMB76035.1 MAG: hypothetical protein C0188_00715 [Fervidicoccus fontis]HEW64253.1 hypothetical protein [Fervidicoccus fontis]
MASLKEILNSYLNKIPGIREYCDKVLKSDRWGGSALMMVIDASFTSTGLNYFNSILPRALEFKEKFVDTGKIKGLRDLAGADIDNLRAVWKNERSWNVAKEIAFYLSSINREDREALRLWAKSAVLEKWREDLIGRMKGMGIVTFQYLRMMGGVDTIVPDRVVKRFLNETLYKSGEIAEINTKRDIEFVREAERIAISYGYRPIELTWTAWLAQFGEDKIKKYTELLLQF